MLSRRLFLSRLRASIGEPALRHRRWVVRALALLAALLAIALSVGWWVYSRTTDQDLYQRAERLCRAGYYREASALCRRRSLRSPQAYLAQSALVEGPGQCHWH